MGKNKTKKMTKAMYPTPDLSNRIQMKIEESFGIVSDTHFGSMHEAVKELEKMYDDFEEKGIRQVFHAGDIVDGENVYRGHNRYLKVHGYEGQANWAIAKYPKREGLTTHFITGNHDMSFYKTSGADIGKYIASQRPDMNYVGMYYVRFEDGRLKLDMTHAAGSGLYAKSYPIQKYIRNNEMPSTYPDMMIFGHYHTHGWFNDHEIECVMAGCFQFANEYAIRRGYVGPRGGWIAELDRDDKGRMDGLKLEWRTQK